MGPKAAVAESPLELLGNMKQIAYSVTPNILYQLVIPKNLSCNDYDT